MRRLALVLCIAAARVAFADDAATLAHDAEQHARDGDYLGAATRFRAAFAADPRPEYECDVGVAFYKGKDLPRAWLYLHRCEANNAVLPAEFRDRLRRAMTAVEAKLADGSFVALDLALRPRAAIAIIATYDEQDHASDGDRLWISRGRHGLVVRAPGYASYTSEIDAMVSQRVEVNLDTEGEARAKRAPSAVQQQPPPRRTPVWIAGAATLASGSFALAAYWHARNLASDAGKLTLDGGYSAKVDAANRWQKLAWAGATTAAIAAAVTAYLWHRTSTEARFAIAPTSGGAIAAWTASW